MAYNASVNAGNPIAKPGMGGGQAVQRPVAGNMPQPSGQGMGQAQPMPQRAPPLQYQPKQQDLGFGIGGFEQEQMQQGYGFGGYEPQQMNLQQQALGQAQQQFNSNRGPNYGQPQQQQQALQQAFQAYGQPQGQVWQKQGQPMQQSFGMPRAGAGSSYVNSMTQSQRNPNYLQGR
jgi:hypothetical protein